MSTTTTINCDRCNSEITEKEHLVVFLQKTINATIDLCTYCASELDELLKGADQRSKSLCRARTFAGENCQRAYLHKGNHVYTSPSDGASISWNENRGSS